MLKYFLIALFCLPISIFAQVKSEPISDESKTGLSVQSTDNDLLLLDVDPGVRESARDLTDQLVVLLELSEIQAEGIYAVNLESSMQLKQLSSLRGKNLKQLLNEVNQISEIRNANIRKVLRDDQIELFNQWQESQDSTAQVRKSLVEKSRRAGTAKASQSDNLELTEATDSSQTSSSNPADKEENKAQLMTDRMSDRLHLDNQQKDRVFDINLESIRKVNRVRKRDRQQRKNILEEMHSVNLRRDSKIKTMLHQKQQTKYKSLRKASTSKRKNNRLKRK